MPLINLQKSDAPSNARANDAILPGNSSDALVNALKPQGLDAIFEALQDKTCIHFVSDGSWSLYDFLLKSMEDKTGANVYITTYSMTELSARIIAKLKESGQINELILMMDYKSKMRYPQVDQLIRNVATTIHLEHIHAKLLIVQHGKSTITLIGSANWTKNPRIEIGVIDTSLYTALDHINWITKRINDAGAGK